MTSYGFNQVVNQGLFQKSFYHSFLKIVLNMMSFEKKIALHFTKGEFIALLTPV